jgi:hypothetical protein
MLDALPFPNHLSPGDRQTIGADFGAAARLAVILFSQRPQPFGRFVLQAAIGELLDAIRETTFQETPVIRGRFGIEKCAPFDLERARRCAL